MFWNLLADAAESTGDAAGTSGGGIPSWVIYLILGIVLVAFIAWIFFSSRKNKSRQKEYIEQLDAIAPGNKVKTAGGICGIVVEVCDDNTVIIETGSELSGKSYVKMDKELIAQTDAKGPTQIAREEAEAKRKAEKEAKEAAKHGEQPAAEEAKTEEVKAEEPAAEKPAEKE